MEDAESKPMELIYPHALVFEELPKKTNFVVGQIIIVPSESKAYMLDENKVWNELIDNS